MRSSLQNTSYWRSALPLVVLTSRRAIMGTLVNRRVTIVAATAVAAAVVGLNGVLLWLAITG